MASLEDAILIKSDNKQNDGCHYGRNNRHNKAHQEQLSHFAVERGWEEGAEGMNGQIKGEHCVPWSPLGLP